MGVRTVGVSVARSAAGFVASTNVVAAFAIAAFNLTAILARIGFF